MNILKTTWSFVLIMLLTVSTVVAQSTISGNVKDVAGEPVFGANVIIKGTDKGAVTDIDGNYSISNVSNGDYTIVGSSLGYSRYSKKISVSGDMTYDFVMQEDAESLDAIVVTGVTNPKAKIESSVSVTTLGTTSITQSAPRTTAEIFRTIPGIRSESSGGEGNSNISVRGVPISSGGSKYVQIQEDGLPVLLYGDISFATADIFTRFDANVKRIEAIRGGSASTQTSNAPGGIINIISKTGQSEGGTIGTTFGANYDSFRTDFAYGTEIADNLYMHAGGFYRVGEGIRDAGFTGNNGGQFKLSLMKKFDKGSVRVYGKYLNDRAIAYLPGPIQVSGTNANPTWESAPNFDATTGSLHTPNLLQTLRLGPDGERSRGNVADGMHPVSTAVGISANFDLGNDWSVSNNGRFASNNGAFISPFPSQVATGGEIAESFGTGSTLEFTDGTAVADGSLVARIHMFDVELENFNNFMNDLKLSKTYDNLDITLGYFKSVQNISMNWTWNSYLQEVQGENARLINAFDPTGSPLSENGLYAYGTPFWGNLARNYDTQYNVSAPYVNVALEASEKLNIDASVRFDMGKVDGTFTGGTESAVDINNDGVISAPEQNVFSVNNAAPTTVDYDYDYVSYSLGLNYKLQDRQAVFARYSRGAAAKADRILFSGLDYQNSDRINALDFLNQAEIGYKQGFDNGAIYVTGFYSKTTEQAGFEATNPDLIIDNDYQSFGVEVEGSYRMNDLSVRGAVTYTNATLESGDNEGNAPRRQPDFIYNLIPSYNFGADKQNSLGLSFIGQTKAYAQDTNELIMPGFVIVNGFVNVGITKDLNANLSANNLFDTLGITESEEGSIVEGQTNFLRARALPGRSISLGLQYNF
ncbi:TonB-dependent receptor [Nonlabens ulvanivorans]|uniref:Predicted sucrose-specific TonB-dependent receptor n=1 Tax=Nonlabens ulvanivorans TaxID=906888 RepID=A0A090QE71_NONUL|nr:TonB-dependent receptor [Nonlabens ulvanivorans]GAL00074.1 predicted sucrose-specific TonB-dependent receptor [Nonlabens ulvanivorans]